MRSGEAIFYLGSFPHEFGRLVDITRRHNNMEGAQGSKKRRPARTASAALKRRLLECFESASMERATVAPEPEARFFELRSRRNNNRIFSVTKKRDMKVFWVLFVRGAQNQDER